MYDFVEQQRDVDDGDGIDNVDNMLNGFISADNVSEGHRKKYVVDAEYRHTDDYPPSTTHEADSRHYRGCYDIVTILL